MLGFITVLLITRMQDIARFAALGSHLGDIFLFTLFQIPYILPIAIPLSGLIAGFLLMQRMSHNSEITSLRSCGIGIKQILLPIVISSCFLSLINFMIVSDLTPKCRLLSTKLLYKVTTTNPLLLIQKSKFLNVSDSFVDMNMTQMGKEASDVLFVTIHNSSDRLSILLAEKLKLHKQELIGENITLISHLQGEDTQQYDPLVIENQKKMHLKAEDLTFFLSKTPSKLDFEHVSLKQLIKEGYLYSNLKPKTIRRYRFEISRRLFYPCITFALTFTGISFGIRIGRRRSKKELLIASAIAFLSLTCFALGKSSDLHPFFATLCFLFPFPIIALLITRQLRSIAKGIEQ